MTDAEVIAEFQRRRLVFRDKASRPSLLVGVPGILLLGMATQSSGLAAAAAYLLALCAVAFVMWRFFQYQGIYRCPRCGTRPIHLDGWNMNPKLCTRCGAALK